MQNYIIYQLINSETLTPFYVGVTKKTLAERLSVHMWCAKNRPYGDISSYINSMSSKPVINALEILKNVSFEEARIREMYWLNDLKEKRVCIKEFCKAV